MAIKEMLIILLIVGGEKENLITNDIFKKWNDSKLDNLI